MNLSADQLGDLRRLGYRVKKVRNGWQQGQNVRGTWVGQKWSTVERAWQEVGHYEGLCDAPRPL